MDSVQDELSQELARIIACPYPASLITLDDIVARANADTIRACVHHLAPCAIIRLASIVAAALPLWPYSLRILRALCHSSEFGNVLLKENTGLLDALLAKANTSQQDFDEYSEICVLLLSGPLPLSAPLPGNAQTFFLHLFERAVKSANVDTLKPVYTCLNGACRGLLSLLSAEARHSFDLELRNILQSSSTGQDSMLLLWCFGIVILSEHPEDVGTTTGVGKNHTLLPPGALAEKEWKTASGRKLFGSSKNMSTTINLTYLSVIWASKGEVGVSDREAIEGIRIATRAMHFIGQDVREGWPKSNKLTKNTAAKLVTKILRKDISLGVQLEALSFYATMVGEHNLPSEVISQYENALVKVKSLHTNATLLTETLSCSLPIFAPHIRESTVRQLLAENFEMSSKGGEIFEMSNMSALLEVLTVTIPRCPSLCDRLLAALSSNELQERVHCFLQDHVEGQSAGPKSSCETSSLLLRRKLQSSTISMLLTTVVAANSTGGLSQNLAFGLINKQQLLTEVSKECGHATTSAGATSTKQSTVSLFEQGCTQFTGVTQQDWRDQLKSELARQNSFTQDTVIRSVAQICQDLESRCNNVEEPLRREQSKVKDLFAQVSQLREQVNSLQAEAIDRQLYADGFEAELSNAENEKQELATKLAELKANIAQANRDADEALRAAQDQLNAKELELAELKSDIAQANKDADEALRAAEEQFNAKELELRSTIQTCEQDLNSRAQTIEDLDKTVRGLEDRLRAVQAEREHLNSQHDELKASYDVANHDLEHERQKSINQAEKIAHLVESETNLEARLVGVRGELEATINERDSLRSQHQELIRSSEQISRDLEVRYTNDMETAALKAREELDRLHAELQHAIAGRQHAKTTYEDARQDLKLAQNSIRTLEARVQDLVDTCAEKDDELEELKAWRSRVLLSMGLPTQAAVSNRTRHDSDTTRGTQGASQQRRKRKSTGQSVERSPLQATASIQGIGETAVERVSNASSCSSDSSDRDGSTPKRPRPRPTFKIPEMHTPYRRKSEFPHNVAFKKASQSTRAALGTLSPNRRHTTVGFPVPENDEHDVPGAISKRRGSVQFGQQDSMGELPDDMPFTPGGFESSTQRMPEDDATEEQTTEL